MAAMRGVSADRGSLTASATSRRLRPLHADYVQACINGGLPVPPGEYVIDRPLDLRGAKAGFIIGMGVVLISRIAETPRYTVAGPCAVTDAAIQSRTETTTPPAGALDNPSPPRIVEGMRCPGCKRKHTVEVVHGSVTHVTHKWNRAVYTCVCCSWHEVKGQR